VHGTAGVPFLSRKDCIAQAEKLASPAMSSAACAPNLKGVAAWASFLGAKLLLRSTQRCVFDVFAKRLRAPAPLLRIKDPRFVKAIEQHHSLGALDDEIRAGILARRMG
jgi:hypothetical protein